MPLAARHKATVPRELTGTRARDILLCLYYTMKLKADELDMNVLPGLEYPLYSLIDPLWPSNVIHLPGCFPNSCIADNFFITERKALEKLFNENLKGKDYLTLTFLNCNSLDVEILETIYGKANKVQEQEIDLTDMDFSAVYWFLNWDKKADITDFKFITSNSKLVVFHIPITREEIDCFIDLLENRLTEKKLLKTYGDEVLSKFINRYSDPFTEELLKERVKEFNQLETTIDALEKPTLVKLDAKFKEEIKDYKKIKGQPTSNKKFIEFLEKINKLRKKNEKELMAVATDKRARLKEVMLEIESIRKSI